MAKSNEEKAFDDILLSFRDRVGDDAASLSKQNSRIISPREIPKNIVSEGRVYFFRYLNPIGRTTLPYYHLFPCVYTLGIEGRKGSRLGQGKNNHLADPSWTMR